MDLTAASTRVENRPLATLAVFAFNQERYIRDTIDAAFAQRYNPLEIILSDDLSSDRTFAIMNEMAAAYDGPHSVRLHRSPKNLGLVNHMIKVARLAQGKYFIVNAGDDISYPQRSEKIIEAFVNSKADCIISSYDEINECGTMVNLGKEFTPSPSTQRVFARSVVAKRKGGIVQSAIGFAASYRTEFWANLPYSPVKLNVEDGLATLILNCNGATFYSHPDSLIGYRIMDDTLSLRQAMNAERESILLREEKISYGGQQVVSTIEYVLTYLRSANIAVEPSVLRELERSAHYGSIVAEFWERGLWRRISRLLRCRRRVELYFVLPRIFGQRLFFRLKVRSILRAE